jgi:diguanylate cyclase (GGDEF)-like protein
MGEVMSKISGIFLIADDNDLIRAMLHHALVERDYQVFEARNGQECLQKYQLYHPDIILLDDDMPLMDGYACCRAFRKQIESADTPIIMISAREDSASIKQAFDSGVTDYIHKPIQWNFLLQRINYLLEQANPLRQLTDRAAISQKEETAHEPTQVLNRRAFDQFLEQKGKQALREVESLSIILTEVDDFKVYRDTYGAVAADLHLQQMNQLVFSAIYRSTDLVSLCSNEQLGILLPNTLIEGAIHVVTRIQRTLKDFFRVQSSNVANKPITLSYGLSSLVSSQDIELKQLLKAAETALLKAKGKGRNSIEIYSLEVTESLFDTEWI